MSNKCFGWKWGLSGFRKINVISWRKYQGFSWSTQEKKKSKKFDGASQTDWTTSTIDKGFERFEGFDCDGEQLQNEEVNVEAESDNLNLMAKAAIMKIEKQQILLVLMKKSNNHLLKHLKSL